MAGFSPVLARDSGQCGLRFTQGGCKIEINQGFGDMAGWHELGRQGEDRVCGFLWDQGYEILERNWRYKRAEVDIIARDGAVLVFLEVKTRRTEHFGPPEAFVGTRKQRFLASAASAYGQELNHRGEMRFDVVSVLFSGKDFHIDHLKDAFFPGLS